MIFIAYLIITAFIFLTLNWMVKIFFADSWLKKNQIGTAAANKQAVLFILIPVLQEERRLPASLEYFERIIGGQDNMKLVYITTAKESEAFDRETARLKKRLSSVATLNDLMEFYFSLTGQCLDKEYQPDDFEARNKCLEAIENRRNTIQLISEIAAQHRNVLSMHYPGVLGKMSHQLNFAIHQLKEDYAGEQILFAVYNVDSRPDARTFEWVLSQYENGKTRIYQQYGNYFANLNKLNGLGGTILRANAFWQNRWSLGFELPHALRQFSFQSDKVGTLFYPMNYCIGHGLFFTPDVFDRFGGFSESMHNEDAIFGLEASFDNQIIRPIPYFDLAEVPDLVSNLFRQQASWYFGPLQAFSYYGLIKRRRELLSRGDNIRLILLTAQLFCHAVYWLVGPTLLFTMLVLPLIYGNGLMLALSWAVAVAYLALPNYYAYRIISRGEKKYPTEKIFSSLLIGAIPMYLLHGLAAYRAIAISIWAKIFRLDIKKEKTLMVD